MPSFTNEDIIIEALQYAGLPTNQLDMLGYNFTFTPEEGKAEYAEVFAADVDIPAGRCFLFVEGPKAICGHMVCHFGLDINSGRWYAVLKESATTGRPYRHYGVLKSCDL